MKLGKWTIVRPDKVIIKQYGDGQKIGYTVENENFWSTNLDPSVHAIQYTGDNTDLNQVEFNNGNKHTFFSGDIKVFADAWDKEHLKNLQAIWDQNNLENETEEQKIIRIGSRPTTYISENIY
jgi:hypothetical protein